MRIVTSLIDLSRVESNSKRKNLVHYLENAPLLLSQLEHHEILLYVDRPTLASPGVTDLLRLGRFEVRVIDFEKSKAFAEIEGIAQDRHRRPLFERNVIKDTPAYFAFQKSKLKFFSDVAAENETACVAWIDLGIGSAVPLQGIKKRLWLDESNVAEDERVRLVTYRRPELITNFQSIRGWVAGGYIHGTGRSIRAFVERVERHYEALSILGIRPHDETVFENVAATWPDDSLERRVPHTGHIFSV